MIRSQSNKKTPTTIKQSISIKISSSANITISNVTKNLTFAFPDGFDHLVLHTAHHSSNNHCSQTGLCDLYNFDDNGNITLILMILIIRTDGQGMVAKIHEILGKRQQKDRRILMVIIYILMTMAIKILTPLG